MVYIYTHIKSGIWSDVSNWLINPNPKRKGDKPSKVNWYTKLINWIKYPKGTWYGSRCSGWRCYPDGKACGGCSDCKYQSKSISNPDNKKL